MAIPISDKEVDELFKGKNSARHLWCDIIGAFRPFCIRIPGKLSRYSLNLQLQIDGIRSCPQPHLHLASDSGRVAAALCHELLHFKLARLGYPRLVQNTIPHSDASQINGVINLLDHQVMRPLFLDIGFSANEFLSGSETQSTLLSSALEAFSTLHPKEPSDYASHLREFLRKWHLGENALFAQFNGSCWQEFPEKKDSIEKSL